MIKVSIYYLKSVLGILYLLFSVVIKLKILRPFVVRKKLTFILHLHTTYRTIICTSLL